MGAPLDIHQDVGRLQIAMYHATFVGVLQCIGNLGYQLGGLTDCQLPHAQPFLQVGTVDEVAGNEDGFAVAANFMHADDTRMLQLGCRPGIAKEKLNFSGF
jgi:hypothetical protein